MTALARTIRRSTGRLVVTLDPGPDPTLIIRERRRRLAYTIPLAALYVMLAQRAADNARARRRRPISHLRGV